MMEGVATPQSLTPLVGRTRELDQLLAAAGIGTDPMSAAVVLGGDAGVGKTRLLHELGERAEAEGWQVLLGHCLDFGESALPYLPFTEMFGRLAALHPVRLAAVAAEIPAIGRLLPGRRRLGAEQPEPEQNQEGMGRGELFEGVHAALEELASTGPVLVAVEDAHWADRSTGDILSSLFARGFEGPVSIVVSYRSDDLHRRHPLRGRITEWGRMPRVTRVNLTRLPDPEVRALVRAAHGARVDHGVRVAPGARPGQDLAEADVQEIVRRAEGNAFFAEELLGAREVDRGDLPADLADLLLVRLDRLDDAARAVVRAAACAGRRVSHSLLATVVDRPQAGLDEALRAAVDANILVPWGDASYAFRHALLAEAVYDDLLPGERTRLHAAYVAALVEGRADGSAAELARHARAAHDPEHALAASIEAGDDAMKVGGAQEAVGHYEQALELLGDRLRDEAVDVDRVQLTRRAAEALIDAGHTHRAGAIVQEAVESFADRLQPEDRAGLVLLLARVAMLSDDSATNPLDLTTAALELIGAEPRPLRAYALAVHARANVTRSQFADAVGFAREALAMADSLGLKGTAVDAATTLGRLNEFLGDPEESARALTEVLDRARAAGDEAAQTRGLHQLGGTYLEMGRIAQARDLYRQAAALARRRERPWAPYGFDARMLAGLTAYMLGDWDEVDRVTDTSGEDPPPLGGVTLQAVQLQVAAGRGDPDGLGRVRASRPRWIEDGWAAILCGGAAIDLAGDAGDLAGAERAYEDVVAAVAQAWQTSSFAARVRLAALLLGQLAQGVGQLGTAERGDLLVRGAALAEVPDLVAGASARRRQPGPEGRAWALRVAAEHLRLRWLSGQDVPGERELRTAWEETLTAFEALEHPFETARTQSRLAEVLRAQGESAAAHAMAESARSTAERLGARPLLAELARGAGPAQAKRSGKGAEAAGAADLTPREREVLDLVARGRTNGQIGAQLFISTKTVSVHVSNILAKVGATGRTEAAALARERGLLGD